jgi:hypothetical protein
MPRVETEQFENVPWKQPVTVPPFWGLMASWARQYRHLIVAIATSPAARNGPSFVSAKNPAPFDEGGALSRIPFRQIRKTDSMQRGQPHPYWDYGLQMHERRSSAQDDQKVIGLFNKARSPRLAQFVAIDSGTYRQKISILLVQRGCHDTFPLLRICDPTKRRWQLGRHMPHLLCDRWNRNERSRVASHRSRPSMRPKTPIDS